MPKDRIEELLNKIMCVVDELVEEAYVVTDGINVSGILTNGPAGEYLANRLRRETGDETWACYTIPAAIQVAYQRGRVDTLSELKKMQSRTTERVKDNEQDSELRDGELQQERQEG